MGRCQDGLEFARNRFEASSPTLLLSPQAYASVGEGNVFAAGSRVVLEGGRVERSGRWRDLGMDVEVTGPIVVLERDITADPAGWWWSHRRWKALKEGKEG